MLFFGCFKVFVRRKTEAHFLVYTEDIRKLEIFSLKGAGRGLSDSDESATVIDERAEEAQELFFLPDFSARPGGHSVSGI